MTKLDVRVVARGALYALCWIVPAAVANALAHAHKSGGLTAFTFLLIVLGFVFAGFAVTRLGTPRPLQHAAAASVLAFALVQGVLDVYRLSRGRPVNVASFVLTALLAACAGVIGALVAASDPRSRA